MFLSLSPEVQIPCAQLSIAESEKLFFSESPKRIAKAKAICATCPALDKCLNFALSECIEHGIFGGTTPDERKSMAIAPRVSTTTYITNEGTTYNA